MTTIRFLTATAAFAAASLAVPAIAGADVYVYRPGPVILAPPPPLPLPGVYVAPAAPVCATRMVGVWVNGVYTYRAVRTCY
jgi:hypothetical protein